LRKNGAAMFKSRKLTDDEIHLLKSVFGDAIAYGRVRIHDGHWTARIPGIGAFVFGDNIQLAGKYVGDPSILIHEAAHVWQFQNEWGWLYFFNALGHQIARFVDGHNPYDYSKVEGVKPWRNWNPEQQAQWIQDNRRLPGEDIRNPRKPSA